MSTNNLEAKAAFDQCAALLQFHSSHAEGSERLSSIAAAAIINSVPRAPLGARNIHQITPPIDFEICEALLELNRPYEREPIDADASDPMEGDHTLSIANEQNEEETEAISSKKCKPLSPEQKARKNARAKKYRETHKEEIAAKLKEYRETHKEEIAAKKKKYREIHKEEIAAKGKQYYETRKEEIATRNKKYYETHKDKIKESNKALKDKLSAHLKDYYETHKAEIAATNKKYREQQKLLKSALQPLTHVENPSLKRAGENPMQQTDTTSLKKLKTAGVYTEMNSKIGNLTRRHPGFEPGLPALEEAKLKKFSNKSGFKGSDKPTLSKTNF